MKTKSVLLVALISTGLFSCQKSEMSSKNNTNPQQLLKTSEFSITKSAGTSEITRVNDWLKQNPIKATSGKTESASNSQFDYNNMNVVNLNNGLGSAIVANQIGYNSGNTVNYSIVFYQNSQNAIQNAYIIETKLVSKGVYTITYYTTDYVQVFSGQINQNTRQFKSFNPPTHSIDAGNDGGGGTSVSNCIQDAYTNHGWVSVWATVQSAFIPETVAAIALACML